VLPPSSETKEPATAAPVAGGLDGAIREEKLVQPTEAVALAESFDAGKIASLRWRQGAICGAGLVAAARGHAPASVTISDTDWLIVTSHDCDVVNSSLSKEPVVELLRGQVLSKKSPDNQQVWGRNPRTLQLGVETEAGTVVLDCKVHERWSIPRELLAREAPRALLPDKLKRLIAEWLAKRYIRAAFPTEFDARWRGGRNLKTWTDLLARHSRWVQGVYLRLNTLDELDAAEPYLCTLIVAVPVKMKKDSEWPVRRDKIECEISSFWKQFAPSIQFDTVEILGTDEIMLADLEAYQRFDADWLSFADDSAGTPMDADMQAT